MGRNIRNSLFAFKDVLPLWEMDFIYENAKFAWLF